MHSKLQQGPSAKYEHNNGLQTDLSRHVHEQHCGYWSLSLTVTLLWSVQSVRLQHPEQILLPAQCTRTWLNYVTEAMGFKWRGPQVKRGLTYPWPPRATNISWNGNCLWRSFSITSSHLGSPGWLSNSCHIKTSQDYLYTTL